jgi:hypothetical protein
MFFYKRSKENAMKGILQALLGWGGMVSAFIGRNGLAKIGSGLLDLERENPDSPSFHPLYRIGLLQETRKALMEGVFPEDFGIDDVSRLIAIVSKVEAATKRDLGAGIAIPACELTADMLARFFEELRIELSVCAIGQMRRRHPVGVPRTCRM